MNKNQNPLFPDWQRMKRNGHMPVEGIFAVLLIAMPLVSSVCSQMPSRAMESNDGTYGICAYGAVGDGTTLNTQAIQDAVDSCSRNGGGRVVVPPGRFLTGTIFLKNHVELHLMQGAVLLGSSRHADYPRIPTPAYRSHKDAHGFYALLYAEGAEQIALTGQGTLDGQGGMQQPRPEGKGDRDGRPRAILLISCKEVRVEGLHLRNSGSWMQHYLNCEDVQIRGLNVFNHSNRNNDGLDIDGCRRVTVSDCILDTDDDAICLKSTGLAAAEDVTISNCVLSSHCTAIKAGTESTGGFRRIVFSGCTVSPSAVKTKFYGMPHGKVGIELEIVDGGTLDGVSISDFTMAGMDIPFSFRLGNRARPHTEGATVSGVGHFRNVVMSNITATASGKICSSICGIPGYAIENISLQNIQLFSPGGQTEKDLVRQVPELEAESPGGHMFGNLPAAGLYIRHGKHIQIQGLRMGVQNPDARWPLWADDVQGLEIRGVRWTGPTSAKAFLAARQTSEIQIDSPPGWNGDLVQSVNEKEN